MPDKMNGVFGYLNVNTYCVFWEKKNVSNELQRKMKSVATAKLKTFP